MGPRKKTIMLTKLSAWDIKQHMFNVRSCLQLQSTKQVLASPINYFIDLEQRFKKTFGGD